MALVKPNGNKTVRFLHTLTRDTNETLTFMFSDTLTRVQLRERNGTINARIGSDWSRVVWHSYSP